MTLVERPTLAARRAPFDRAARFEQYVQPELQRLHAAARRLTWRSADAEDLVQETLLRAYGALDRFDGRFPRAWLMTIMRNTHINGLRRRRPDLIDSGELGSLPQLWTCASGCSPEAMLDLHLDEVMVVAWHSMTPPATGGDRAR